MYLNNYILSLKRRHQKIDSLIQDELSRPLPDSLSLLQLKLNKLKLKEKISKASHAY
jgi:hypothetical protein